MVMYDSWMDGGYCLCWLLWDLFRHEIKGAVLSIRNSLYLYSRKESGTCETRTRQSIPCDLPREVKVARSSSSCYLLNSAQSSSLGLDGASAEGDNSSQPRGDAGASAGAGASASAIGLRQWVPSCARSTITRPSRWWPQCEAAVESTIVKRPIRSCSMLSKIQECLHDSERHADGDDLHGANREATANDDDDGLTMTSTSPMTPKKPNCTLLATAKKSAISCPPKLHNEVLLVSNTADLAARSFNVSSSTCHSTSMGKTASSAAPESRDRNATIDLSPILLRPEHVRSSLRLDNNGSVIRNTGPFKGHSPTMPPTSLVPGSPIISGGDIEASPDKDRFMLRHTSPTSPPISLAAATSSFQAMSHRVWNKLNQQQPKSTTTLQQQECKPMRHRRSRSADEDLIAMPSLESLPSPQFTFSNNEKQRHAATPTPARHLARRHVSESRIGMPLRSASLSPSSPLQVRTSRLSPPAGTKPRVVDDKQCQGVGSYMVRHRLKRVTVPRPASHSSLRITAAMTVCKLEDRTATMPTSRPIERSTSAPNRHSSIGHCVTTLNSCPAKVDHVQVWAQSAQSAAIRPQRCTPVATKSWSSSSLSPLTAAPAVAAAATTATTTTTAAIAQDFRSRLTSGQVSQRNMDRVVLNRIRQHNNLSRNKLPASTSFRRKCPSSLLGSSLGGN